MLVYINKWIIYSERSGSHIVSQLENRSYQCDCIGWTRHFPRINCKHINEVIHTNPPPIDRENWEKLKGKKHKVLKTIDFLSKISEEEKNYNIET